MIRWKNWKLWGLVFLFFVGVWFVQLSAPSLYKAKSREVPEMAEEYPAPAPDGGMEKRSEFPPPPPPASAIPVQTDVWGWVVKGGVVLSGLKTLLDIVDKLKKKASS